MSASDERYGGVKKKKKRERETERFFRLCHRYCYNRSICCCFLVRRLFLACSPCTPSPRNPLQLSERVSSVIYLYLVLGACSLDMHLCHVPRCGTGACSSLWLCFYDAGACASLALCSTGGPKRRLEPRENEGERPHAPTPLLAQASRPASNTTTISVASEPPAIREPRESAEDLSLIHI